MEGPGWLVCAKAATLKSLRGDLFVLRHAFRVNGLSLTRLPDASPETITEETPSATVTPTQSHGRGKAAY